MSSSLHRARRGLTLLELLAVLAIGGLLSGIAVLSLTRLRDAILVRSAARELADAFAAARAAALSYDAVTLLAVTASTTQLRLRGDTADLARTVLRDLDAVDGAPRVHRFAPDGLMLDAGNATYLLRRGAAAKRVIVAKYGRVRIE